MSGIGVNSMGKRPTREAVENALQAGEVIVAQGRAELRPLKGFALYTKGCHVVVTDQRLLILRRYKAYNPLVGFLALAIPMRKPYLLFDSPLESLSLAQVGPLHRQVVGALAQFAAPDGREWQLKPGASGMRAVEALNRALR